MGLRVVTLPSQGVNINIFGAALFKKSWGGRTLLVLQLPKIAKKSNFRAMYIAMVQFQIVCRLQNMQLWCVLDHQSAYLVLSRVIYDFNWTIAITIFTVWGKQYCYDWPRPRPSLTFSILDHFKALYTYKYVEQQQQICSLCIAAHFTHCTDSNSYHLLFSKFYLKKTPSYIIFPKYLYGLK